MWHLVPVYVSTLWYVAERLVEWIVQICHVIPQVPELILHSLLKWQKNVHLLFFLTSVCYCVILMVRWVTWFYEKKVFYCFIFYFKRCFMWICQQLTVRRSYISEVLTAGGICDYLLNKDYLLFKLKCAKPCCTSCY